MEAFEVLSSISQHMLSLQGQAPLQTMLIRQLLMWHSWLQSNLTATGGFGHVNVKACQYREHAEMANAVFLSTAGYVCTVFNRIFFFVLILPNS